MSVASALAKFPATSPTIWRNHAALGGEIAQQR